MQINIAEKGILDKILERKRRDEYRPEDVDLGSMLGEILRWATRFVPSESGSILLDDPTLNPNSQKAGNLYFVACFGKGSAAITCTTIPSNIGIAGSTYTTGKPYISRKVINDRNFYSKIDQKTNFQTKSIICAPIVIRGATIGVIELLNRLNGADYGRNDLTLLKIFAEYTSTLIQNSLDAKKFGELSIRDNLTGLHNDRYFYDRLTTDVQKALRSKKDLSLLFLDLDRFKEVNDTYGHLAGSRVLAELGVVLAAKLQSPKATAARYGGDEFVLILPGSGPDEAFAFAEDLRKTIQEFVFLKKRHPGGEKALRIKGIITGSIGVTALSLKRDARGLNEVRDALIKEADTAMYASKLAGKNRVSLSSPKPAKIIAKTAPASTRFKPTL